MNLFDYPFLSYAPNPAAAGCVAGIVFILLTSWFVQSIRTRFQPRRLSVLLFISQLAIFIELIVRASIGDAAKNSRIVYTVLNSLFAIGQRMIIVSNYSFVLEVHHVRSCFSRGTFLGAVGGVISSGLIMIPANIYAFNADQISTSFIFRQLSASILLLDTILFYWIFYLSKTIGDMKREGIILIFTSSILCLIAAMFNLFQSISIDYYNKTNSNEFWFYGLQLLPIILAHFTWSILHPKRSLTDARLTKPILFVSTENS